MVKSLIFQAITMTLLCLNGFSSLPESEYHTRVMHFEEQANATYQPESIGARIYELNQKNDKSGLLSFAEELKKTLNTNTISTSQLPDIYYYIGVCQLLAGRYFEAIDWLQLTAEIKESERMVDDRYLKCVYNLGVAWSYLGYYERSCTEMLKYVRMGGAFYGENSSQVASGYSALISSSIESKKYDDFRNYSFKTLEILNTNPDALKQNELGDLYTSIGVGYAKLADYTKAKLYLEEAESFTDRNGVTFLRNYINLINSLAITYGNLGLTEKEELYFEKGMQLAINDTSFIAFNLINSYAIDLGREGNIRKGEELLSDLLDKAVIAYGRDSRYYIDVLKNFAEYIRDYKGDTESSIKYFEICYEYLERHPEEVVLRDQIIIGYSLALSRKGESFKALEMIRNLLYFGNDSFADHGIYEIPDQSIVKPDRRTVVVLKTRYDILLEIFSRSDDIKVLVAAAETSGLIISMVDRMRINISEEESRLMLGVSYRDVYLWAIRDYELCYRRTADPRFLEKAFEFGEKSKVAGLLAATREMNAVQFHIPEDIAEIEMNLHRDISYYNSRITIENNLENPDQAKISELTAIMFELIRSRDSLILAFEKEYPGYYTLKYNTRTLAMNDIPVIIGKRANYLNYVLSDSLLYLFVVNRKFQKLLTVRIDTAFMGTLSDFRKLLSDPSESSDPGIDFVNFQETGVYLYKTLIEPVTRFFISDNLLISPDNLLSYLPFESLIKTFYEGKSIYYRKLDYLMNYYNVSYTYSATFMEELVNRRYRSGNKLVAFAPEYKRTANIDSIFNARQFSGTSLFDLPYARIEAEYVARSTEGKLYLGNEAKESIYKMEAWNYDIIHLAMHTYVSDRFPMNSAMIFAEEINGSDDGFFHTYEVYGIPLRAKMVVLSSCNTGSGMLSTGEGILSLARGFLYSGSKSVVMSMWEVEDRSGTEIIRSFYDNLKKGKSKSKSLRSARFKYLKKSNQVKSHPYFWSGLVIYGSNDPVFTGTRILTLTILSLILSGGGVYYYFRKRKYS